MTSSLFLLLLLLIAAWASSPAVLGRIGEHKVDRTLSKALDASEYRLYPRSCFPVSMAPLRSTMW